MLIDFFRWKGTWGLEAENLNEEGRELLFNRDFYGQLVERFEDFEALAVKYGLRAHSVRDASR